jgi:ADP-ribosylglycohydrolase
MGIFMIFISGCDTTPTESCEQEEICVGKSVTACCTETNCYYEFNGVEYGDDTQSMLNLANALGCTQASDPTYKEDIDDLVLRLEALGEITRAQAIKK